MAEQQKSLSRSQAWKKSVETNEHFPVLQPVETANYQECVHHLGGKRRQLTQEEPTTSLAEKRGHLKLSFHSTCGRKSHTHTSFPGCGYPVPIEKGLVPRSIQSSGKLKISPEITYDFTADDLADLGEIGRGAFGTVNKMVHKKSGTIMGVKRIRSTVDEKEQKQLLMDLEVVMKSNDCPFIVQFYGAIFKEGDCWICMELMDSSLDKLYKFVHERQNLRIPESILGKITVATVKALNYLKEKLNIIHRDVKPSNILLDCRGNIKLCDFGISGQLVDSIAKTRDAGCRPYMAPERIDPGRARGYDVRSDVWSLGITLIEVSTGKFPYPKWNSVFEQLTQVVQGDPPQLSPYDNGNAFTVEFVNFVNTCLIKEEQHRPKYKKLLEHPFIIRSERENVDVAGYINSLLRRMDTCS